MNSLFEIAAIVRNYPADCQPARIEPLGMAGGMSGALFWRMASPRGALVLRRWPVEHPKPERLRFIHAVLFHAVELGIAFIPAPILTASRASFVRNAGHLWELAPWMRGVADYERAPNAEKLRAAMNALAMFHLAAKDFPVTANQRDAAAPAVSHRLLRLQELHRRGTHELSASLADNIWPELAPLARQFLATLPTVLPPAIRLLEPLAEVALPVQPCLRDIWHDHVLFTGNEVNGIIDFGAVDIDTPATDIARLLGSLVGDDPVGWRTGMAAYSIVRPLAPNEERAVSALDASGTILAGCNWLRWIAVEGRQFEDRTRIIERFRKIVARCNFAIEN